MKHYHSLGRLYSLMDYYKGVQSILLEENLANFLQFGYRVDILVTFLDKGLPVFGTFD